MSYLSNIPQAIFNNILLLGILWMAYQFAEQVLKLGTKKLFVLAVAIQTIASGLFLLDVFTAHSNSIISFQINPINSIILSPTNPLFIYIGVIYLIGLFLYLIHFMLQVNKLHQLKQSGNYATQAKWLTLLKGTQLNIPANLSIGLSDKVTSPMVFGFMEPIILLPLSICNHLSNEEIKLILMHELAHIIRNDYLVNLFIKISKILLWFNPFSYLITNRINLLRELACDQFVINHSNNPVVYSKALYQLAYHTQNSMTGFAMGAVNNNEHELLTRIKCINKLKYNHNHRFQLTFLTILFVLGSLIASIFISNAPKENKKSNLIVVASEQQSIANKEVIKKVKHTTVAIKQNKKRNKIIGNVEAEVQMNNNFNESGSTTHTNFDVLLNETRNWIKKLENPIQFANYTNDIDSVDNLIAERLLLSSIIKSYQLKRTILSQKLSKAQDKNEAFDYLMNSKEWADIIEYEKWAEEYLRRHQQSTSLPTSATKQQIQY